jgi:class 3 adenylate cyclase
LPPCDPNNDDVLIAKNCLLHLLFRRIGIHSGPVTAGVLRGERARFQLFGDTMNTAARVESSSQPGRIQLSKATAELLIKGGKSYWLEKREEKVSFFHVCVKELVLLVEAVLSPQSHSRILIFLRG